MNRWVACAAFKGLELYDGKLSRTVLMGRRAARPLATRLGFYPESIFRSIRSHFQYGKCRHLAPKEGAKWNVKTSTD